MTKSLLTRPIVPDQTSLATWMESTFVLGPETPRPGPLRLDDWQREPVDALTAGHRTVVFKFFSQSLKSLAVSGKVAHHCIYTEAPMLLALPTGTLLRNLVRQKLFPLLSGCPEFREAISLNREGKIPDAGIMRRDGRVAVTFGTGSAHGQLQGTPSPYVIVDELDTFIAELGITNSPVDLLYQRGQQFEDPTLVMCGTPASADESYIQYEYDKSSGHERWVLCEHCGDRIQLLFEFVGLEGDEWLLHCPSCSQPITEPARRRMLQDVNGAVWLPQRPGVTSRIGYHINQFHSAQRTVAETMENYDPTKPRAFTTQVLALAFKDVEAEALTDSEIEALTGPRPEGDPWAILVSVDTQDGKADPRLEYAIVEAFGSYFEPQFYVRTHRVAPVTGDDWVSAFKAVRDDTRSVGPSQTFIDIGSAQGNDVIKAAVAQAYGWGRGEVKAIKGIGERDSRKWDQLDIIQGERRRGDKTPPDHTLAIYTDIVKNRLMAQLRGGGVVLTSDSSQLTDDSKAQLGSEKLARRVMKSGYEQLRWVKVRPRNELLDLLVYACAAAVYLGPEYRRKTGAVKLNPLLAAQVSHGG